MFCVRPLLLLVHQTADGGRLKHILCARCLLLQAKATSASERKRLGDDLKIERAGRQRAEELLVKQVRRRQAACRNTHQHRETSMPACRRAGRHRHGRTCQLHPVEAKSYMRFVAHNVHSLSPFDACTVVVCVAAVRPSTTLTLTGVCSCLLFLQAKELGSVSAAKGRLEEAFSRSMGELR